MMNREPLHSLRVAYENWADDKRFVDLMRLLKEYPGSIDQVSLFTTATHIPTSLPELSRRMKIAAARMEEIRRAGLSAGVNILPTIGHHCEDLDSGLGDRYTYMTNADGEVCRGSYCMRNPRYIGEYVIPCYTLLAEAKPDYIWIDDDIRYGHMPIGNGCFCDGCVESFNRKHGTDYTREMLKAALDRMDVPLRRKWLDHSSEAISSMFRVIGRSVRAVNPAITLGFMTGERYFEGYQFANYADALSENGKYRIMWRPGGGAYEDLNYEQILEKQEQIGRQCAYLPEYVTVVQSEIENFPYQLINKTPKSTAFEAAMSMTVGCTGAAFNILPSETGEPMDNIVPHLKAIDRLTDFYRTLAEETKSLAPEGIHTGWRIDSQAAIPPGNFTGGYGGMYAAYCRELFSFGLPECYHPGRARVTTMTGAAASVMDDAEIRTLLSGGVYLDASALTYLRERGFGLMLGFEAGREIPVDAREQYVAHPLNQGIEGGLRNCRQAFHPGDSFVLETVQEGCQSLSRLIDYHDRPWCECACGVFENELGGRVCAAGYYPFSWISDAWKTRQLKRLFVWLSRGTLPSFVDSYHRIRNVTLTGGDRMCVTLFNRTNDDQEHVRVAVRTDRTEAQLYTMYDSGRKIASDGGEEICGGKYRYFEIGRIKPFEGVILSLS